jgi:hypothetical protein
MVRRRKSKKRKYRTRFLCEDWEKIVTVESAHKLKVMVGRPVKKRSLAWLARNDPAQLDSLLGRTSPDRDPELFHSLVLLCDTYKERIALSIGKVDWDGLKSENQRNVFRHNMHLKDMTKNNARRQHITFQLKGFTNAR